MKDSFMGVAFGFKIMACCANSATNKLVREKGIAGILINTSVYTRRIAKNHFNSYTKSNHFCF